jgi:hypothetical protein
MSSGKRPSPGAPGGRRRRPPTTIELQATEVAAPKPSAEPAASERTPPVAPALDPKPEPAAQAAFEPPPPREPPPRQAGEFGRDEPGPARRRLAWLPEELSWPQVNSAAAGAAGGLIAFFLLWLLGAFSGGREPAMDLSPRLAAIERQLSELAARPAPPSVDPKAIADLSNRLGRLEMLQAAPRAPVTDPVVLGRLNATESAVKSAADNVAALSRRASEIEAALRATNGRLDALAASLAELRRTAQAAAVGSDRAVRLAVAASALRAAVDRGDPFAAELAVVKPLAPDPIVLAPLEPFAATGVPSETALARELLDVLQPMLRSAGEPPRDGTFLERLQANAGKLVRIRPIDEARGDDRAAILSRVEARAGQNNIAGALAELAKLPPSARAPADAWIARAQARNRAAEVSRRFAADAMAALNATP